MAKVKNPRKKFLFRISFPLHPVDSFKCQKVTLPDIEIDQVLHGDVNRDVKTAGRVKVGNLKVEKLLLTSGPDNWVWDWLYSAQDMINGGGLTPSQYSTTCMIEELAEDGETVLNINIYNEVWPCKISGFEFDRNASENVIEVVEFAVGTADRY